MAFTRLVSIEDASSLAQCLSRNREFLAPWDPLRDDDFFTADVQRGLIEQALESHSNGTMVPLVILGSSGELAGRINIAGITRGALQSGGIGYWVSKSHNGRGLASGAVAEAKDIARQLGLHRLQAETLLHNEASQRVLTRNGFAPYGMAPQYLNIAGKWQDHIMFQVFVDRPSQGCQGV